MVILDTNIIIDHLRNSGDSSLLRGIVESHDKVCISIITLQELYTGKSTLEPKKERTMLETISGLFLLEYTYKTAKIAGGIGRDYGTTFADAAIAATAIEAKGYLATLNIKHFSPINDLKLLKI